MTSILYTFSSLCYDFRYWRPWNRGRAFPDLKYIIYGWAYVQDMIEHAIIRQQTNMSSDIGVEVQQFPHPCWTYDRYVVKLSLYRPYGISLGQGLRQCQSMGTGGGTAQVAV